MESQRNVSVSSCERSTETDEHSFGMTVVPSYPVNDLDATAPTSTPAHVLGEGSREEED